MQIYLKLIVLNDQGLPFMGKGAVQLLRGIERLGSINQAAKEMNLSYVKALRIIKKMEASLEGKILKTTIGGRDHGGSELTPLAVKFLDLFTAYEAAVADFAEEQFGVINKRLNALRKKIDP
jgi:molybdate transport system regulatory protein